MPVIGLSATPWTRGLGKHFDKLIIAATTQELIEAGYLSKFRVFAPASPDLTDVRTVAGDYRDDDLSEAMDKTALVADVVETWIDRAARVARRCASLSTGRTRSICSRSSSTAGVVGRIHRRLYRR